MFLLSVFLTRYPVLNLRQKRQKLLLTVAFLGALATALVMQATLFSGSVAFAASFASTPLDHSQRGKIACFIDIYSCTNCEGDEGYDSRESECPEWSNIDVTRILQTQAKSVATMAIINVFYTLFAIRFGFDLRKRVRLYQIDYV
jgi:hypothetical protein